MQPLVAAAWCWPGGQQSNCACRSQGLHIAYLRHKATYHQLEVGVGSSVNVSEPGSPPLPTSCLPTPGPLVLNNAHIEEQGLYPASQPGTRNAQTSLSPSGAACPTGLYALAPNRHQAAGRPGGWGNGQLNTLAFLLPGLFHSGVIAFYARTALFLREHESCALKCKKLSLTLLLVYQRQVIFLFFFEFQKLGLIWG